MLQTSSHSVSLLKILIFLDVLQSLTDNLMVLLIWWFLGLGRRQWFSNGHRHLSRLSIFLISIFDDTLEHHFLLMMLSPVLHVNVFLMIASMEVSGAPLLPRGSLQVLDERGRHWTVLKIVIWIVLGQRNLIDLIAKLLDRHILEILLLFFRGFLLFTAALVSCRESQVDHGWLCFVAGSANPLLLAGYVTTMLILCRVFLDHWENADSIIQSTLLIWRQYFCGRLFLRHFP